MDIRNIKTEPPQVENRAFLEKMFDLQKELMEGYIRIEGLPRYPLNINSKKSQVVLKDFASRVTEELAEGYESTHFACEIMEKHGWNIDLLSEKEHSMLINHLQNSNEEQADATAFYLELLIYADINAEDLREFALEKLGKERDSLAENSPILDILMITGVKLLNSFNPVILDVCPEIKNLTPLVIRYNFESVEKYNQVKAYIPGFHAMSPELHHQEMAYLWQIQYHLGVGRNYLKNKPWKQTGELSDERPYMESLMEGFIKMMGYHSMMGITPEGLYYLFFKKNQVNCFRQRSNY